MSKQKKNKIKIEIDETVDKILNHTDVYEFKDEYIPATSESDFVLITSSVDHPQHYHPGQYEAIKVIDAWGLDFYLGNALKYISRAGLKDKDKEIEDLQKAIWYIQKFIEKRK